MRQSKLMQYDHKHEYGGGRILLSWIYHKFIVTSYFILYYSFD